MNKLAKKLIATVLMLALVTVMMVTVSYAWMTLSDSPEVSGIQISIGGNNTILIAPDVKKVDAKGTYHYPGAFGKTLNFNYYEQYGYLSALDGLSPVSTADGQHWFIPEYYTATDEAVINGYARVGDVKPIEYFRLDTELSYANVYAEGDERDAAKGHYVYLDFWVVSPSDDFELRISRGDDGSGSFLVELPEPEDSGDGYTLGDTEGFLAASARIGFLVDHNVITDETMLHYADSAAYSDKYGKLRGNYAEPGEGMNYSSAEIFTIYEPNGDLHPGSSLNGYSVTEPIGWNGGAELTDVRDRLSVQKSNVWKAGTSSSSYLEETFQSAIASKNYTEVSGIKEYFYKNYLQRQLLPYVDQGSFIKSTAGLYEAADGAGRVSAEGFDALETSGATEDVCIAYLERNIPQRIRMFVWIEGQDADCVNLTKEVAIALSIELAGGHTNNVNEERKQKVTQ